MSRHKLTVIIDVDEEELVEHVTGGKGATVAPYTTLVSEWDASDIFAAYDEGIIDPQEATIVSYDGEVKEEGSEDA